MTAQPWFFAIESVSSDDPPSAMMISPTTPVSGFKQWANSDASFSVGMITDMFGRGILEWVMECSTSKVVIVLVDPKRFKPIIVWAACERLFGW